MKAWAVGGTTLLCVLQSALLALPAPVLAALVGADGCAAGWEHAAARAKPAAPPMPFNRSRRETDAMLLLSLQGSAFDCPRGDAFDNVALDEQEQNQHRQDHVQRACHDDTPQRAGFLLKQQSDADRQGPHLG